MGPDDCGQGGIKCSRPSIRENKNCLRVSGQLRSVSRRNNTPSLLYMEGILPNDFYQWKDYYPIVGISGRNSAPSLLVGGIVPHHCYQGRGIGPHHWYQWEE
ncbi:unnamed protein product [Staurois parvus]|uniref:Uncharacterized protein n=1 Tax=Staurois parvus TaxID=386267 RepID=A0ABN9A9T5_9NEOB|nr:unnamed protein product [Staurois parvus]